MNLKGIFSKIFKGDKGEADVINSLNKLLGKDANEENYYLIPKLCLNEPNGGSREVDVVLLHPIFGIYLIEVKNYQSLELLNNDGVKDPFLQVREYRQLLLAKIEAALGKIPINVEFRVIFPSISKQQANEFCTQNPSFKNYENHAFFKDDLQNKDIFARFFNSSVSATPNKKEFLKIAELLISKNEMKNQIIPVITKDEIVFFDRKQLSVMSGYTGGFRIIRGVAGTGKTMILTNFIANRLKIDDDEKFLVLCFNKNLAKNIKECFADNFSAKNIAIYPILSLLKRIKFNETKLGISEETSLEERYKIYETDAALNEFRDKFSSHLRTHPIDFVLVDETQDMPAGFMRIIYECINDCVFFIDEAQKFYPYTMNSIADVFHHPKFSKISMQGRVKNLKNVYRTPSNIAKCAFEILANDKKINDYYQKSFYLSQNSGFLDEINCILASGEIKIVNVDDFSRLKPFLAGINDDDTVVLSNSKKSVEAIKTLSDKATLSMQGIKGLEAECVIIHNFLAFLKVIFTYDREIFYRKIYVLLTRSGAKLYISLPENIDENLAPEIKNVINTIKTYASNSKNGKTQESDEKSGEDKSQNSLRLARIRPVLHDVKEGLELVVAGSELFGIIAGLFSF